MEREYQEPIAEVISFEDNIKALTYASPGSKEDSGSWDDIFGGN